MIEIKLRDYINDSELLSTQYMHEIKHYIVSHKYVQTLCVHQKKLKVKTGPCNHEAHRKRQTSRWTKISICNKKETSAIKEMKAEQGVKGGHYSRDASQWEHSKGRGISPKKLVMCLGEVYQGKCEHASCVQEGVGLRQSEERVGE
jgi:hypothetical protein